MQPEQFQSYKNGQNIKWLMAKILSGSTVTFYLLRLRLMLRFLSRDLDLDNDLQKPAEHRSGSKTT